MNEIRFNERKTFENKIPSVVVVVDKELAAVAINNGTVVVVDDESVAVK